MLLPSVSWAGLPLKRASAVHSNLSGKCVNATVSGICPASFAGYHYLCTANTTWADAAGQCSKFGWQLAPVTDLDAWAAQQTMQACASSSNGTAWIASFNGLVADPCMVQAFGGAALAALGEACEASVARPVLCKQVPVETLSLASTRIQTLFTGPAHVTVTVTPSACHHRPYRRPRKHAMLQEQESSSVTPLTLSTIFNGLARPCSPVCPFSARGIRVVQEPVLFAEADAACRKHGWSLADYSSGMAGPVRSLLANCTGPAGLWIRSYNGVDGAACLSVAEDSVDYGYSPLYCDRIIGPLYPLCQTSCNPARTGLGPWEGTNTSFTMLSVTTMTTRVPLNTITVTATVWPKHDPHNDSCCCRECVGARMH